MRQGISLPESAFSADSGVCTGKKVALFQLTEHLKKNKVTYTFQSTYRHGQSTKTALLRVLDDLLVASDCGKVSVLTLLDLPAAFDTIDYHILLDRLQNYFCVSGSALNWFQSYLSDRR